MKLICAWCRRDLGEKEPLDDNQVSHGCCDECIDRILDDFKKLLNMRYEESRENPTNP